MLQCVSVCCTVVYEYFDVIANRACGYTGVCVLQCAVVCGNVLREDLYLIAYDTQCYIRTVNICILLQQIATHCKTMQHTATHCNNLDTTHQHGRIFHVYVSHILSIVAILLYICT